MGEKPLSANLNHFLSDESRRRPVAQLKDLYEIVNRPGMISMGGGMPTPAVFPFDDVRATSLPAPFERGVAEPIVGSKAPRLETEVFKAAKGDISDDIELASALQYGWSSGDERLRQFFRDHMERVHDIGFADWDISMHVGNTFAWDAVMRTLTNPGDSILVEEFSFPSALENAAMHDLKLVPVRMDQYGVIPESLAQQLKNWQGPLPKLFYIIPTGQNPTGSVLSAERRQAIYDLAHDYDFLIIEDEPYYYLQMDEYVPAAQRVQKTTSRDDLLKSFVPSFLHFDTDGRVIRLDSFSKIMAPGIRLGWFTGQKRLIQALIGCCERSSSKPSGLAQSLVYGLLRRWGQDGFLDWLVGLRQEYTRRRDVCVDAIHEKLPKGRYSLVAPTAGMFFWLVLDARQHPSYKEEDSDASKVEIKLFREAVDNNVLLVPGHWCMAKYVEAAAPNVLPRSATEDHEIYFRGTFASQPLDQIREGITKFGQVLERSESSSYIHVVHESLE